MRALGTAPEEDGARRSHLEDPRRRGARTRSLRGLPVPATPGSQALGAGPPSIGCHARSTYLSPPPKEEGR
uniref:Uncharacterized protein n=1 Tax=Rangifer tarandus platyrhynchus TaxID=3082113 RepID=A0ACB0FI44_RANTA|nr:unnamed protein product [Rangifer tarandus platyrhynchus]